MAGAVGAGRSSGWRLPEAKTSSTRVPAAAEARDRAIGGRGELRFRRRRAVAKVSGLSFLDGDGLCLAAECGIRLRVVFTTFGAGSRPKTPGWTDCDVEDPVAASSRSLAVTSIQRLPSALPKRALRISSASPPRLALDGRPHGRRAVWSRGKPRRSTCGRRV